MSRRSVSLSLRPWGILSFRALSAALTRTPARAGRETVTSVGDNDIHFQPNVCLTPKKLEDSHAKRVVELNWHWLKFYSAREPNEAGAQHMISRSSSHNVRTAPCAAGECEELGTSKRCLIGLLEGCWVNIPSQVQFFQPIVANGFCGQP